MNLKRWRETKTGQLRVKALGETEVSCYGAFERVSMVGEVRLEIETGKDAHVVTMTEVEAMNLYEKLAKSLAFIKDRRLGRG